MNSVETGLLILLVLAFVIYRQLKTRPADRSSIFYISAVVIVIGLVSGGLFDPDHFALSLVFLAAEAVIGVGLGILRAMTVQIWTDAQGAAWSKGTVWTLLAWLASIAVRVIEQVAGTSMGLTVTTGSILIFVGLTLATQALVVSRRARALPGSAARSYNVER